MYLAAAIFPGAFNFLEEVVHVSMTKNEIEDKYLLETTVKTTVHTDLILHTFFRIQDENRVQENSVRCSCLSAEGKYKAAMGHRPKTLN